MAEAIPQRRTARPHGLAAALLQQRFFYGWVIVAVSFVTMFLVIGTRFSLGIFYVAILEAYHWSRAVTRRTLDELVVTLLDAWHTDALSRSNVWRILHV